MSKRRRWKSESAVIHASGANTEREIFQAVVEQLFEARGSKAVASLLAEALQAPTPDVIATVACWLDPQADDYIQLVVQARRGGKRMTKRVNDATIAHAVTWRRRALGNKRGSEKVAVSDTAERYGVSEATVRKALRSFKGVPAPSEAFKPFLKK
jgi:hypothetical protein